MDYPLSDAFISYAHEDVESAKWLYEGLSNRGLHVFLDEAVLRFGENVPARIEQCLEHSISVLLLLSRRSLGSAWVTFESRFDWCFRSLILINACCKDASKAVGRMRGNAYSQN